jgi:GDP-L-fucose synthase
VPEGFKEGIYHFIIIQPLRSFTIPNSLLKGQIIYDKTKPDGTPRKLLDVSNLTKLGWKASISLREGVEMTYDVVKVRTIASQID